MTAVIAYSAGSTEGLRIREKSGAAVGTAVAASVSWVTGNNGACADTGLLDASVNNDVGAASSWARAGRAET